MVPFRYRLRRLVIGLFTIVIIVLALLIYTGHLFIDPRYSAGRILGKSPDEVVAMFGAPADDTRHDDHPDGADQFRFMYFDGWYSVVISFRDGKAIAVDHGAK